MCSSHLPEAILLSLQKKCIRNILNLKRFESSSNAFRRLMNFQRLVGVLSIHELFEYNACKFMFKFHNKNLPRSFEAFFQPLSRNYRTLSYVSIRINSRFLERFPTHFLVRIWNDRSIKLKSSKTINQLYKKFHFNGFEPLVLFLLFEVAVTLFFFFIVWSLVCQWSLCPSYVFFLLWFAS